MYTLKFFVFGRRNKREDRGTKASDTFIFTHNIYCSKIYLRLNPKE